MTSRSLTLPLPEVPVDGGLSRYFQEVWRFPMLEAEEEYMLAERYRTHSDADAAHRLVTSHLRLVARIAMKYKGYGLPMADLVSEGNIGLMRAVKKFEPERGFRLSTYAMWWIKAAITEYVLKSWSLVKLGTVASQKKLFFSLRTIKSKLNIMDSGELNDEQADELSENLNVSVADIRQINRRMSGRDASLNARLANDGDMEFQDTLVDDRPSPESVIAETEELNVRQTMLRAALEALPQREREILMERRLSDDPKTLEELGEVYGVSRERIRQLEARAFGRVQATLLDEAAEKAPDMLPTTA